MKRTTVIPGITFVILFFLVGGGILLGVSLAYGLTLLLFLSVLFLIVGGIALLGTIEAQR